MNTASSFLFALLSFSLVACATEAPLEDRLAKTYQRGGVEEVEEGSLTTQPAPGALSRRLEEELGEYIRTPMMKRCYPTVEYEENGSRPAAVFGPQILIGRSLCEAIAT